MIIDTCEQELVNAMQRMAHRPKSVETEKGVDVLGEIFEQSAEGRPKYARIESAAIKRLHTSKGVMSAKPSERGQMPKGVQSGFIEEVDDDEESATIATMVDIELNEVKLSYEEACTRSDWQRWREGSD